MLSIMPPVVCRPIPHKSSQLFSRLARHMGQVPSPNSGCTATRSPTLRCDTEGLTSVTTPANSWPMTMGRCSPLNGWGCSGTDDWIWRRPSQVRIPSAGICLTMTTYRAVHVLGDVGVANPTPGWSDADIVFPQWFRWYGKAINLQGLIAIQTESPEGRGIRHALILAWRCNVGIVLCKQEANIPDAVDATARRGHWSGGWFMMIA